MTIIHVTIPDHAEALGVVGTLLKQGYHIAIDLDGESEPTVGPPWLAAEMSRREWVEAFQANSSVAVERGLSTPKRAQRDPEQRPFVDERELDFLSREEAIRRMHARHEMAEQSEAAINAVACPLCKVHAGERCVTAEGSLYSWRKVHKARWHAYVTRGDDVTPAR